MSRALFADPRRYTVEEYFQIESTSEIRHELIDGRLRALDGESDAHSAIVVNVHGVMWQQLRGTRCQARESGLRIRFGRHSNYGYADALIFRDEPQFDPLAPKTTTLLNPRVLFEVLSEETEAYDRGRKFEAYREIPSFEEYVLVSQDRPSIDVFRRTSSGLWQMQPYCGLDTSAQLLTVGIELPLADVYAGIAFPPEKPDQSEVAT